MCRKSQRTGPPARTHRRRPRPVRGERASGIATRSSSAASHNRFSISRWVTAIGRWCPCSSRGATRRPCVPAVRSAGCVPQVDAGRALPGATRQRYPCPGLPRSAVHRYGEPLLVRSSSRARRFYRRRDLLRLLPGTVAAAYDIVLLTGTGPSWEKPFIVDHPAVDLRDPAALLAGGRLWPSIMTLPAWSPGTSGTSSSGAGTGQRGGHRTAPGGTGDEPVHDVHGDSRQLMICGACCEIRLQGLRSHSSVGPYLECSVPLWRRGLSWPSHSRDTAILSHDCGPSALPPGAAEVPLQDEGREIDPIGLAAFASTSQQDPRLRHLARS